MTDCRRQALIEAPIEIVWDLIRDVNRHPEWWPRVVDVECGDLEEGCSYRQVMESPFGYQQLNAVVDRLDEMRELRVRCTSTGTFVDLALAAVDHSTFIDARFGIEPVGARMRAFDLIAGRRYFRRWLEQSLDAMERVAVESDSGTADAADVERVGPA